RRHAVQEDRDRSSHDDDADANDERKKKRVAALAEAEAEAVAHAVQNDRLPVRSVLQMLFSEHGKLNRLAELSGGASFGAPSLVFDLPGARCPPSARCSPSTTSSAASARTSPASRSSAARCRLRWTG
ncbi:Os01g0943100, partial [Oryza sativa Japonica Group]